MAPRKTKAAGYRQRKLSSLSPTEFENLIYDLMTSSRMVNVAWRTPGADGGRDIEGITTERDLSGTQVTCRWFVECKKYKASVDWPTIYEKLAYAESNLADFLLMCTTATFSPNAISHVDAWNARRSPLKIRLWPKHEIENQLLQHPDLSLKYRLSKTPPLPGGSIVALALALSKTVSSHFSRSVFAGRQTDLMLQASQTIADLLLARMEEVERYGAIQPSPPAAPLELPNCTFKKGMPSVDEFGLRAFISYLAALTNAKITIVRQGTRSCLISSTVDLASLVRRYSSAFFSIALWSEFEIQLYKSEVRLWQRNK
jgi:hypothetical protein